MLFGHTHGDSGASCFSLISLQQRCRLGSSDTRSVRFFPSRNWFEWSWLRHIEAQPFQTTVVLREMVKKKASGKPRDKLSWNLHRFGSAYNKRNHTKSLRGTESDETIQNALLLPYTAESQQLSTQQETKKRFHSWLQNKTGRTEEVQREQQPQVTARTKASVQKGFFSTYAHFENQTVSKSNPKGRNSSWKT